MAEAASCYLLLRRVLVIVNGQVVVAVAGGAHISVLSVIQVIQQAGGQVQELWGLHGRWERELLRITGQRTVPILVRLHEWGLTILSPIRL